MRLPQWMSLALILLFARTHTPGQSGVAGVTTGAGSATTRGTVNASVTNTLAFTGIKDAPFSADVVEETDQTLADGNRIHREIHGRTFRDSVGRTRNETESVLPLSIGKKRVHVRITDPVQQCVISLDPQQRSATVQHLKKQATQSSHDAIQPAANPNIESPAVKPDIRKENLGTLEIEGFLVTGKRVSRIFQAGEIGNEKPITSTTEIWYSPDLHIPLLTKSDSPQSGKHVRKIINITTADPDPALFQIPSEYSIRENSQ